MEKDSIIIITAFIGALIGYVGHIYTTFLQYKYKTKINEIDLLQRIDSLQKQIVDMSKENASLREEIASLRQELKDLYSSIHPIKEIAII